MAAARGRLSGRRPLAAAGLALALALATLACRHTPGIDPLDSVGLGRIDEDEEREIGRGFDRGLHDGDRLVDDPEVNRFVQDLGLSLVEQVEPQPFVYRFRVVRDRSLNAFAVPGGYVYLHAGTILRAGSLDELAGVVGHEIGHVDGHHFARLHARTALPGLLANLAAVGAAAATGEPGLAPLGQGLNQALELRWSRDLERDADERSGAVLARAGYDPAGVARFFERIQRESDPSTGRVPPYLYSHPQVEERIESVRARAEHWRAVGERASGTPSPGAAGPRPDPASYRRRDLEEAFRRTQRRLAVVVDAQPDATRARRFDPRRSEPLLERARQENATGQPRRALASLTEAALLEPEDPRIHYRLGEILERLGDDEAALAAYHRTLELDRSRGLVYYRIGIVYRNRGERHRAVDAFESAWLRFADGSPWRKRADFEIAKLEYGVFEETGLRAGAHDAPAEWWGRMRPRFRGSAERVRVRWIDPSGAVVQEGAAEGSASGLHAALLAPHAPAPASYAGEWTVETLLDGAVVDRRRGAIGR